MLLKDSILICIVFMLLLLLSRFSRVRLCATPEMAAYQALLSLGLPGKDAGVGCHFLFIPTSFRQLYMHVKAKSCFITYDEH